MKNKQFSTVTRSFFFNGAVGSDRYRILKEHRYSATGGGGGGGGV